MTEAQILHWIKQHVSPIIRNALTEAKKTNPLLLYTEDLLAGMHYRETGFLIARYVGQGKTPAEIWPLLKGDYTQRKGEVKPQYHGYSGWQIDTGSYPRWIKEGHWKDPYKSCLKAIEVLEEKRKYLQKKFPTMSGDMFLRSITAAYNCGQGNVVKALATGNVDVYTHQKNYSKEVWRFRSIYKTLS